MVLGGQPWEDRGAWVEESKEEEGGEGGGRGLACPETLSFNLCRMGYRCAVKG